MNTQEECLIWEIRQTAGMVFQNPINQLVATVVEEDIAFAPKIWRTPKEIRMRVDEALDAVRMKEFAALYAFQAFGGQKQRIAIAGVLAMKPDCIVLDEPTAMLDPVGRRDVMETIELLNKEEGITVILITHYMDELCVEIRVYVIDDGDLVMKVHREKFLYRWRSVKEYGLDVPQVTEVTYLLRKEGIDLPADILTVEEMVGA